VLVFRANQFATYSGPPQAPDDIDSGAPPIKLQFLLRLNRNGLIGWWAHNAGWHMESVTVGLLNSKSWLLFIRRFLRVGLTQRGIWLTSKATTGGVV